MNFSVTFVWFICEHFTNILCNVPLTFYRYFCEILCYAFTYSFFTCRFYRENVDILQRFSAIKEMHFTDIIWTSLWHLCGLFVDILLTFYAMFGYLFTDILVRFYAMHSSRIPFLHTDFTRENVDILHRFSAIKDIHFTSIVCTFQWHFVYFFCGHFTNISFSFSWLTFNRDNTEILMFTGLQRFFLVPFLQRK